MLNMLVINVLEILDRVQITSGGRTYTCPMKNINDELFFKFKGEWHRVIDYLYDK